MFTIDGQRISVERHLVDKFDPKTGKVVAPFNSPQHPQRLVIYRLEDGEIQLILSTTTNAFNPLDEIYVFDVPEKIKLPHDALVNVVPTIIDTISLARYLREYHSSARY